MSAVVAFVVRLVGYALLIGIPARVAEFLWQRAGLDGVDALRSSHDLAMSIVPVVPIVLAFFGFGPLRNAAVFVAMYIAAAALTAPFALARLAASG